jgi:hypothetical protein
VRPPTILLASSFEETKLLSFSPTYRPCHSPHSPLCCTANQRSPSFSPYTDSKDNTRRPFKRSNTRSRLFKAILSVSLCPFRRKSKSSRSPFLFLVVHCCFRCCGLDVPCPLSRPHIVAHAEINSFGPMRLDNVGFSKDRTKTPIAATEEGSVQLPHAGGERLDCSDPKSPPLTKNDC